MIVNLLDRMKLPFRKNKEFLSALYDILGFYPHDIEIYRIAFSHKSLGFRRDEKTSTKERKGNVKERRERRNRNENTSKPLNNERLEYLGDAVLETVVSDILFRHFSNKREGFLTSTRSKIVQREALNRLAAQMGLENLIIAAQGTRMSHTNIGGNAFEALMGAIYLDRGYKYCHWFISNRIIGRYVDLDNVAQKEVNFKSKLLEWSQKNRINTTFKDTVSDNGEKGFSTIISIEGIIMGRGTGRSKKESQQEASKEALTRMRQDAQTYDSIFRAKEKRTAMEAEESFALPKIEEIEESLNITASKKCKLDDAPILEERRNAKSKKPSVSDEAYDTAYDEDASYEVIDTPPAEDETTSQFVEDRGIPAPPDEDELRAADEKLRKKRSRNRGAKTVGDAVKGIAKGTTTAEEKAEKREAERIAEVERQRAKAERKRKEKQKKEEKIVEKQANEEPIQTIEQKAPVAETSMPLQPDAATAHAESEQNHAQLSALIGSLSHRSTEDEDADKALESGAEVPQSHTDSLQLSAEEIEETTKVITEEDKLVEDGTIVSETVIAKVVEDEQHPQQSTAEATPQDVVTDDVEEAQQASSEVAENAIQPLAKSTAEQKPILNETNEDVAATQPNSSQAVVAEKAETSIDDAEQAPSEPISITPLPKLSFDDIIFGTSHDDYASFAADEENVADKARQSKSNQNRRRRRNPAQKAAGKKSSEKKSAAPKSAQETTADESKNGSITHKDKGATTSQQGENANPDKAKKNNRHRRPYKGKRSSNNTKTEA